MPDYGTDEVSDHALMLLLAIARRLLPANKSKAATATGITRSPFGTSRACVAETARHHRLVHGIGTAMVAVAAKAIGMRVVIYDPMKPDGLEKALAVERCYTLEDLLRQSEFVSVHCPLTAETRHILNGKTLPQLPRGRLRHQYAARGPCVDPNGLLEALEAGHVAYAALDVAETEPLNDERIAASGRILLTLHTAFYSVDGYQEMRSKGAEEGRRILLGEPVRNPVNLKMLANPRCKV